MHIYYTDSCLYCCLPSGFPSCAVTLFCLTALSASHDVLYAVHAATLIVFLLQCLGLWLVSGVHDMCLSTVACFACMPHCNPSQS